MPCRKRRVILGRVMFTILSLELEQGKAVNNICYFLLPWGPLSPRCCGWSHSCDPGAPFSQGQLMISTCSLMAETPNFSTLIYQLALRGQCRCHVQTTGMANDGELLGDTSTTLTHPVSPCTVPSRPSLPRRPPPRSEP